MSNAMHEQSAPSSYEEGEKDVTDHMGYTAVDPAACMISEDPGERAGRGIVQAERYHHLSVLQKCVPEKKILELCGTVFYSDSCGDMFLRPCPGDPRLSKYHPEASAHLERVHQEQTVKVSKEKEIEPWDLKNPTKVYRPTRSVLEDSVYDQHPEFGFGYR